MRNRIRSMSAAMLLAASMALPAFGQMSTSFTYQGKLKLSGAVVNAAADFQFRLFSSSSGGTQIGSTLDHSFVNVVDGLFTSTLNFGADAFNGDDRWLEIAVRSPAGTGSYVILTPRQRITAAPHALSVRGIDGHSLNAADGSPQDVVYVNNDGNVGIGTTSPQGRLDIRSGNNSYWRIDTTNGDLHGNGGSDGAMGIINDTTGPNALTAIIMGNNPHLVVRGNGNVGIGTTDPTSRLEIFGQNGLAITGFQPFLTLRDTNANGARAIISTGNGDIGFYTNSSIPAGIPPVIIKDNGFVGMGDTNPAFRLQLPNIANEDGRARANGWTTYSSIRWKDNVQTIDSALDKVMQLRGVSFDWKPEHGGAHDIGFVAEEVGSVVPELVSWEQDGQWAQGVAYDRVTALAVEAIKEQQRRIESLQKANDEMRGQIAELMRRAEANDADAKRASR